MPVIFVALCVAGIIAAVLWNASILRPLNFVISYVKLLISVPSTFTTAYLINVVMH